MFVSFKTSGASMIKYAVVAGIVKLGLIVAFFYSVGGEFFTIVDHVEAVINDDIKISLRMIFGQIGWMFLKLIGVIVIELIVVFGLIMPIANREINNSF